MPASSEFRFAELVLRCLKQPDAFESTFHRPVDVEVIPNFSGDADRIEAWLIFDTRERAESAEASSTLLRSRALDVLRAAGFPSGALKSFRLSVTSVAEIEEGGGRFAFFR